MSSKKSNFLETFDEFMAKKSIFYKEIEYETVKTAWRYLARHIVLPYVIHIVGTNGKGTTGRFIASFLKQANKQVLHYTSPHILKFNERIWINGSNATQQELENTHKIICEILPIELLEKLTYFEYSTLLAIYLSSKFDFLVLEAGLGGEFDATNIVPNNLTVIPSVGLDHQDFLGNTITEIASTKLRSCDRHYIFGENIHEDVLKLKNTVLKDKIEIPIKHNLNFEYKIHLPEYIYSNLKLALSVVDYLGFYKTNLTLDLLEGRCQKIRSNITIDVGHNPLAADTILKEFKNKKITLIYNSYKDKNFKEILTIMKPIVENILIIKCNDERMIDMDTLLSVINELKIDADLFDINMLSKKNEYLVFGSFKVVETFMKLISNQVNI